MTRRGTLAYYLAAWVIGCFVVSLMLWIIAARSAAASGETANASLLLRINFISLIFGAPGALFFAYLLRVAMRWWGSHAIWKWTLMGAWLAVVPVLLLVPLYERYSRSLSFVPGTMGFFLALILAGPGLLSHAGLWQVPIEGAVLGAVLCLVDRAFDRPAETGETPPPPN